MGDLSPAPPALSSWRSICLTIFPWMAWFGVSASKALKIKSAVGRTELEGGGSPALAARDTGGKLAWNAVDSQVYYLAPGAVAYVPVAVYSFAIGPPPLAFPGTVVALGPGSGKVSIG